MFYYCLIIEQGDFIDVYDNLEDLSVIIATYLHRLGIENWQRIELMLSGKKLSIFHHLTGYTIMIWYVGYGDGVYVRNPTKREFWELAELLAKWFNVDIIG